MDQAGYHALTCRHMGSFGVRHNALRETFLHFLSLAGIPTEREAPFRLPGSAARPADIFVPNFAGTQAARASTSPSHTPSNPLSLNVRVCVAARPRSSTRSL